MSLDAVRSCYDSPLTRRRPLPGLVLSRPTSSAGACSVVDDLMDDLRTAAPFPCSTCLHAPYGFVRGAGRDRSTGWGALVSCCAPRRARRAWSACSNAAPPEGCRIHRLSPLRRWFTRLMPRVLFPPAARLHVVDVRRCGRVPYCDARRARRDTWTAARRLCWPRNVRLFLGARREAEVFGRLGAQFQLTNFVRVSGSTMRLTGSDLPAEGLERSVGCCRARPLSATPQLRALLSVEVGRARALFGETVPPSPLRCRRRGAACASRERRTSRPRSRRGSRLRRPRAFDPPGAWGSRGPRLQGQGRSRDLSRRRDARAGCEVSGVSVPILGHVRDDRAPPGRRMLKAQSRRNRGPSSATLAAEREAHGYDDAATTERHEAPRIVTLLHIG